MSVKKAGARARALGAQLRDCRDWTGMTVRAAADGAGWDKSTLSRIEQGSRTPTLAEVAQLLGVYRVVGDLCDDILRMARAVDEPGWWEHGNRGLPGSTTALSSYEQEAVAIIDWAPLLMPGLLQTADYTRAWLRTDGVEDDGVALRVDARMHRQRILGQGLRYTAFIGETTLRTAVGTSATMAGQLAALRSAGSRPDITVRVVPGHCGAHQGQTGAFHLMRFTDASPVVLVELLRSSVFMDEQWQSEPYTTAATGLAHVALGETESAQLITRMQARWSDRARTGELAQVQL